MTCGNTILWPAKSFHIWLHMNDGSGTNFLMSSKIISERRYEGEGSGKHSKWP